ncbi:hypothetical protein Bbelb_197020 [Branchiostoma belcheri]|nr:hypothetical protein Bbelb_197020 [Branchiostoma belcheri]
MISSHIGEGGLPLSTIKTLTFQGHHSKPASQVDSCSRGGGDTGSETEQMSPAGRRDLLIVRTEGLVEARSPGVPTNTLHSFPYHDSAGAPVVSTGPGDETVTQSAVANCDSTGHKFASHVIPAETDEKSCGRACQASAPSLVTLHHFCKSSRQSDRQVLNSLSPGVGGRTFGDGKRTHRNAANEAETALTAGPTRVYTGPRVARTFHLGNSGLREYINNKVDN